MTSSGYPVQPSVTIPSNALTVTISNDGVGQCDAAGNDRCNASRYFAGGYLHQCRGLAEHGRESLSGENGVQRAHGQYAGTNGSGVLNQRYVETSNVNVAEELVSMIATQRAYD